MSKNGCGRVGGSLNTYYVAKNTYLWIPSRRAPLKSVVLRAVSIRDNSIPVIRTLVSSIFKHCAADFLISMSQESSNTTTHGDEKRAQRDVSEDAELEVRNIPTFFDFIYCAKK